MCHRLFASLRSLEPRSQVVAEGGRARLVDGHAADSQGLDSFAQNLCLSGLAAALAALERNEQGQASLSLFSRPDRPRASP